MGTVFPRPVSEKSPPPAERPWAEALQPVKVVLSRAPSVEPMSAMPPPVARAAPRTAHPWKLQLVMVDTVLLLAYKPPPQPLAIAPMNGIPLGLLPKVIVPKAVFNHAGSQLINMVVSWRGISVAGVDI